MTAETTNINNPSPNTGGTEGGTTGGSPGGAPGGNTPSAPVIQGAAPVTYELKVDGESVHKTAEELVVLAQKGVSADSRFQEASRMKQQAAAGTRVMEAFQALSETWDEAKFREIAPLLGMGAEAVEATISNVNEQQLAAAAPAASAAAPGSQTAPTSPPHQVRYSDMSPEIQNLLVKVQQETNTRAIKSALENDDVLKYNMGRGPEVQKVLLRWATDEFHGRIRNAAPGSTEAQVLENVVATLRRKVKESATLAPPVPTRIGLGPAPSGSDADFYPTKKPERVQASDGTGHENYIDQMIRHALGQGEQAKV